MKRISKIGVLTAALVFITASMPFAVFAGQGEESGQVADASEMVAAEKVLEEGMSPVYGGQIKDGTYSIDVNSSSSMFRVVDAELIVENGKMTAVMTMGGKGYLYVFMGTGQEAAGADESEYIPFAENPDGSHSFTVPVEALDQAIDCAAFSKKKEKWYDRSLCFAAGSLPDGAVKENNMPPDGEYTADIVLSGGTGRAWVKSPANVKISEGRALAEIIWSSPDYDYMIAGGTKYLPIEKEGEENSVFEIPLTCFDIEIPVKADTLAMSVPHEISYTLCLDSSTLKKSSEGISAGMIAAFAVILIICTLAGVPIGKKIYAKSKK